MTNTEKRELFTQAANIARRYASRGVASTAIGDEIEKEAHRMFPRVVATEWFARTDDEAQTIGGYVLRAAGQVGGGGRALYTKQSHEKGPGRLVREDQNVEVQLARRLFTCVMQERDE